MTAAPLQTEDAVCLQGVSKRFGAHQAVCPLDLTIPKGAIYGVLGPNGSGKTTTLRMMLRIYRPDTGTVQVLGRQDSLQADDRVGYLPEERGLYRRMTVRRTLRYFARLKGCRKPDATIEKWMRFLKAEDWYNKRIDQLSKGMAQKVQFVASIASNPQLVILDEPLSGLDPVNMDLIKQAIMKLRCEGTTVVLSTHDMSVAEKLCDRVCMVFQGRKVLDGPIAEILANNSNPTIITSVIARDNEAENRCRELPGLLSIEAKLEGKIQMRFAQGLPKRELLQQLLALGEVEHFEVERSSLHDIFVGIAQ